MATRKLDKLVKLANEAADKADWQGAIEFLSLAEKLSVNDSGVLSGLGACLLQLKRPEEAIPYFSRVVELESQLPDAFCNLGMAYSAAGQLKEAEDAFLRALAMDGSHIMTRKNLAVLYAKQDSRLGEGLQLLINLLKDNPKDLESVLMLASYYLLGKMYDSAEKLCQYALNLDPGNAYALQMMEQIRAAEPANETQVQPEVRAPEMPPDTLHIARPEHANKLSALKKLHTEKKKEETASQTPRPSFPVVPLSFLSTVKSASSETRKQSVLFCAGQELASGFRIFIPAKILENKGIKTKVTNDFDTADMNAYDVFFFHRPHLEQAWIDAFYKLSNAGKRVVIDIDENFHELPEDHPGYKILGPGNPQSLNNFEKMLARADLVTTSSKQLAEYYHAYARKIEYLPTTWDRNMELWNKQAPIHNTFNVGWCDFASEIPNLKLIRREVASFVKETGNALLVIGGDLRAIDHFNGVLPEEKILFVPFVTIEDYPFLLAHFDVILSPQKKSNYNQSKPDTRLVEAGARRIPWIASGIPSFKDWNAGGLVADRSEEWVDHLQKLYQDPTLRKDLGEAGRKKAEERESEFWTIWSKLF